MKQTILILLSSILLFSCSNETSPNVEKIAHVYNPFLVEVIVVNQCQYVIARTTYLGGGLSIIHAANCTNSTHGDATDFPEEWQALGNNKHIPDTLCAYKDSVTGVAHIAFLNK